MASHDDDTMPEETQGYKLSQPKQSLAEYQQMGRYTLSSLDDLDGRRVSEALRYAQHMAPEHVAPSRSMAPTCHDLEILPCSLPCDVAEAML